MLTEWNIRSRGKTCAVCNKAFEEGDACLSFLKNAPDGTLARTDACESCAADGENAISLWRFTFRTPGSTRKARPPFERENAESLFRRLLAEDDPTLRDATYVLAVMLERARVLVPRGTSPDSSGGLLRIYEHRTQGDAFIVRDPLLPLDRIGPVQQQVAELLAT